MCEGAQLPLVCMHACTYVLYSQCHSLHRTGRLPQLDPVPLSCKVLPHTGASCTALGSQTSRVCVCLQCAGRLGHAGDGEGVLLTSPPGCALVEAATANVANNVVGWRSLGVIGWGSVCIVVAGGSTFSVVYRRDDSFWPGSAHNRRILGPVKRGKASGCPKTQSGRDI